MVHSCNRNCSGGIERSTTLWLALVTQQDPVRSEQKYDKGYAIVVEHLLSMHEALEPSLVLQEPITQLSN